MIIDDDEETESAKEMDMHCRKLKKNEDATNVNKQTFKIRNEKIEKRDLKQKNKNNKSPNDSNVHKEQHKDDHSTLLHSAEATIQNKTNIIPK